MHTVGQQVGKVGSGLLGLARQLIPAEGNDWGAVVKGGAAEDEFLERVGPLVHDDFVTVWPGGGAGPGETSGMQATLAGLRAVGQLFDALVAIPDLYVELGDRVLVLMHRKGRTVDGQDFNEAGAAVYVFDDGLLCRMQLYAEPSSALRDCGITADEATARGVPPEA